ncbi:Uncharacterised protein [uncultured archaeon]|nr:Uncharacterised protein [uncultured archaeon]
MTRKYNTKAVQKPLSEVVAERRGFYEKRIGKAFDSVYASGNFQYIEKFENVILGITQRAVQGNLEGIVIKPLDSAIVVATQATGKPVLTKETYATARGSGMTNEQIKKAYRIENKFSLGGFTSAYEKKKKVQEAKDPRPKLTYQLFVAARDAGVTNKQIIQQYKREYPRQVNVFSMEYVKAKRAAASPTPQTQ